MTRRCATTCSRCSIKRRCRTSWRSPHCKSPRTWSRRPASRRSPGNLGVYSITALLGRGGMGEVYRARDTRLGRDVAIKVLPRALTADPDRLARFEREARMLASLNHPHIGMLVRPRGERPASARWSSSWWRARRWPNAWRAAPVPFKEALTLGAADCRCARCGTRERHRAPRSETREHQDHAERRNQGAGLRARAHAAWAADVEVTSSPTITQEGRRDHRDGGLHESGAGARPGGRQARGRVGVRLRALRAADRADRVCRVDRARHAGGGARIASRTGWRCRLRCRRR